MGEIVNVILAVLAPVTAWFTGWFTVKRDRRKVYEWLRENTRDYPGESHTDTATIAKGTRLTEERVRRACMTDERVYRLAGRRGGTLERVAPGTAEHIRKARAVAIS